MIIETESSGSDYEVYTQKVCEEMTLLKELKSVRTEGIWVEDITIALFRVIASMPNIRAVRIPPAYPGHEFLEALRELEMNHITEIEVQDWWLFSGHEDVIHRPQIKILDLSNAVRSSKFTDI